MKKNLILIQLLVLISYLAVSQQSILKEKVIINNEEYIITLEKYNGESEIWARTQLGMSNYKDVHIITLEQKLMEKDDAMQLVCRGKEIYDSGKTIAGCAATIGTGVCIATGGGAGIGVPVCTATVYYTATTGFVDCISGLTSIISRHFGYDDFGYAAEQAFGSVSAGSIVSVAIDAACEDWEQAH